MDLTTFTYITSLPEVIDNATWYALACRAFNLGLTAVWILLLYFVIDTIFNVLARAYSYSKGGGR